MMHSFYFVCVLCVGFVSITSFRLPPVTEYSYRESTSVELLNLEHPPSYRQRRSDDCSPNHIGVRFTADNNEVRLSLQRNYDINVNAPLFVNINGTITQETLENSENVAVYQDLESGSAILIQCVPSTRKFELFGTFYNGSEELMIEPELNEGQEVFPAANLDEIQSRDAKSKKEQVLQDQDLKEKFTISHHVIYKGKTMRPKESDFILKAGLHPKHRAGTGHSARDKRATTAYQVELLMVADYSAYSFWLTKSSSSAAAKVLLRQFYAFVLNGIDLRYKSLTGSSFTITVLFAGLYIAETPSNALWTESRKNLSGSVYQVNASAALVDFESWIQSSSNLPGHDHAMLFTAYDLEANGNNAVAGLAYLGAACTTSSQSIVEDNFDAKLMTIAAHELGHSLGAWHDGTQDGTGNSCSPSLAYIMSASVTLSNLGTPGFQYNKNLWKFSSCSMSYFQTYINTLNSTNCLTNLSVGYNSTALSPYDQQNPGQVYPADTQCRYTQGNDSYLCRTIYGGNYTNLCTAFYCLSPGRSYCSLSIAAERTTCGDRKWCVAGECVTTTEAPSVNDTCPFGNQPGIVADGQTCTQLVANSSFNCYNYAGACCESCQNVYTGIIGCEYGDKAIGCTAGNCAYYDNTTMALCCKTCYVPPTTTTTTRAPTTTTAIHTTITTTLITTSTGTVRATTTTTAPTASTLAPTTTTVASTTTTTSASPKANTTTAAPTPSTSIAALTPSTTTAALTPSTTTAAPTPSTSTTAPTPSTSTAAPTPNTTTTASTPSTTTAALTPSTTTAAPTPTTTKAPTPSTSTAAPTPSTSTAALTPSTSTAALTPSTSTAAPTPTTTTAPTPTTTKTASTPSTSMVALTPSTTTTALTPSRTTAAPTPSTTTAPTPSTSTAAQTPSTTTAPTPSTTTAALTPGTTTAAPTPSTSTAALTPSTTTAALTPSTSTVALTPSTTTTAPTPTTATAAPTPSTSTTALTPSTTTAAATPSTTTAPTSSTSTAAPTPSTSKATLTPSTTTAAPTPSPSTAALTLSTATAAPTPSTSTAALTPATTMAASTPSKSTAAPTPSISTAAPTPSTSTAALTPSTSTAALNPTTTTAAPTPSTTTAPTPSTSTAPATPSTSKATLTPSITTAAPASNTSTAALTPSTSTAALTPTTTTAASTPSTSTAALTPTTTTAAPTPSISTAALTPSTTTSAPTPSTSTAALTPSTSTAALTPITTTAAPTSSTTTAPTPSTSTAALTPSTSTAASTTSVTTAPTSTKTASPTTTTAASTDTTMTTALNTTTISPTTATTTTLASTITTTVSTTSMTVAPTTSTTTSAVPTTTSKTVFTSTPISITPSTTNTATEQQGTKKTAVTVRLDYNVSSADNLSDSGTYSRYVDIVGESLREYYTRKVGQDIQINIRDIRRGSLIVEYDVVIKNIETAQVALAKANIDLAAGENITVGGQVSGVESMVVENMTVPIGSSSRDQLCTVYILISGVCPNNYKCVVFNSSPVCQPIKTTMDIVPVTVAAVVAGLVIAIAVVALICSLQRRSKNRAKHLADLSNDSSSESQMKLPRPAYFNEGHPRHELSNGQYPNDFAHAHKWYPGYGHNKTAFDGGSGKIDSHYYYIDLEH